MKNTILLIITIIFLSLFCRDISYSEPLISITAVGDIMPGTSFPDKSYLPPADFGNPFKNFLQILKDSDIVFGNLEGSINENEKCIKSCNDPEKCFAFRIPEYFVPYFEKAGFNLFSIANNHIGDFGMPGRIRTAELLSKHKIIYAGTDSYPFAVFRKGQIRFGFTAFAPNEGTNDIRDIDKATEIIQTLKPLCDIIIVSFHGGAEGPENRHVTKAEEFSFGEDRGNVYKFSHSVIDAGADLVLGHGPHITKAVELYKKRFITYSMGNFCTYARFNLLSYNGIAPLFKLFLDKNGEFKSGKIISVKQIHKKAPETDENGGALKEITELTKQDFPSTPLEIDKTGNISITNSYKDKQNVSDN